MSQRNPTNVEEIKYSECYVLYADKSQAFRAAFQFSKASLKTINEKASRFHALDKVQARIKQLRDSAQSSLADSRFTIAKALEELDEAIRIASTPNKNGRCSPGTMVSATMGKAKIEGLQESGYSEDSGPLHVLLLPSDKPLEEALKSYVPLPKNSMSNARKTFNNAAFA
jgi:hypothetical protein